MQYKAALCPEKWCVTNDQDISWFGVVKADYGIRFLVVSAKKVWTIETLTAASLIDAIR